MVKRFRPDEQHKYNSPWNIAADIKVDMSFHIEDIKGMLEKYEADQHTGLNIQKCARFMILRLISGVCFGLL